MFKIILVIAVISCSHAITESERQQYQTQLDNITSDPQMAEYMANIYFKYYSVTGAQVNAVTINDNTTGVNVNNCSPENKYAIIVHGWTENCTKDWVQTLVGNFNAYRGGCVICMDYNYYSQMDYASLRLRFPQIVNILTAKFIRLTLEGFNLDDGYVFAHSFGSQVAAESGRQFGVRKFKNMDLCDPAGPLFDPPTWPRSDAAQNVQCIHTSMDKGTWYSNCDQDWLMGNCGITQDAAGVLPLTSHILCAHFYNYAFNNNFLAIPKPLVCVPRRWPLATYPQGFKMGYMETRKSEVYGDLYADTTSSPPYT